MRVSRRTLGRLGQILDQRGAALAMVAVCVASLLTFMALAVDLGLAYTARSEAQRVADAAALAGASAFIDHMQAEDAVAPAKARAKEFAARNNVRSLSLDTMSVTSAALIDASDNVRIQVVPDSMKVRVWVRRGGIGTFFARLLGVNFLSVQAMAAAEARSGGSARCIWPFSGPDLWSDGNDDDGDGIPEEGEAWGWDGEGVDRYEPWDGAKGGTGYGSPFRNGKIDSDGHSYVNDFGRPMAIKTTSEGQSKKGKNAGDLDTKMAPGNFLLWAQPDVEKSCSENGSGAQFLYNNIVGCNQCGISLDGTYDAETEPGQKWGKVRDGIDEIIRMDPGVRWDSGLGLDGGFVGSTYPPGNSPRMVPIALAHPEEHPSVNGRDDISFNNFALVFIEGYDKQKVVRARFMGYVSGSGGPTSGSLIRYLRLVE